MNFYKQRTIDYFKKRFPLQGDYGAIFKAIEYYESIPQVQKVPSEIDPSLFGLEVEGRQLTLHLNGLPAEHVEDEARSYFEFFPYMDWENEYVEGIGLYINWNETDLNLTAQVMVDWLVKAMDYKSLEEKYSKHFSTYVS